MYRKNYLRSYTNVVCSESSAEDGFPVAGDWRTRRVDYKIQEKHEKSLELVARVRFFYASVRCQSSVNDHLKNMCQIEHSRHRSVFNFLVNLMAGERCIYLFTTKTITLIFIQKTYLPYLLPFFEFVELTFNYQY